MGCLYYEQSTIVARFKDGTRIKYGLPRSDIYDIPFDYNEYLDDFDDVESKWLDEQNKQEPIVIMEAGQWNTTNQSKKDEYVNRFKCRYESKCCKVDQEGNPVPRNFENDLDYIIIKKFVRPR